ncbi:Txe/YoeB family addiction module toxin [Hydrogenimonas thermophila]|uniref:Toxin YoeB n=1 Tax=Hydrogenimonas thermophila TaxID=223786 RepID=A0A1I5QAG2_9BACT|nr:Txe/YoeB family addiction module toxin [Hydrogenimonas thermophila]WOE70852.1 Txe/YoeB family addiction module toxin [Hydrogenimonas thermophila]WOE73370.1 Txe/YoeB family addiction module toxin [Hydrogenimonas thermophila]SFP43000.1 toxin YoeB [Hydrogenimonas thermophila]
MNITFTNDSWNEYLYWQKTDKQILKKINQLLNDIKRTPFSGIGKPEPLKFELSGCWSRRITNEHRLVYEVTEYSIVVISCKYHY